MLLSMSPYVPEWAIVVLVSTAVLSIFKPLLETWVPWFKPGTPTHNPLLVALNVLICLGCVLAPVILHGAFSWPDLWSYLIYTIEGATGSQTTYHLVTTSGLSVNAPGYAPGKGPDTTSAAATTTATTTPHETDQPGPVATEAVLTGL